MFLINGIGFEKWTIEDIQSIIDNPDDYRENEEVDYKENFTFLDIPHNNKSLIKKAKDEFRNDVCAFANSDGGYLIFGIRDNKGKPSEIKGICIDNNNTDKFELNIRNELAKIMPVMPSVKFRFIKLSDSEKYIIIIKIEKGFMIPYVGRTDDEKYSFKKRQGNGNRNMNYNEVSSMFNQSLTLSDMIEEFRKKRIDYFDPLNTELKVHNNKSSENERFLLFHIIPENILNKYSAQKMYLLDKRYFFETKYLSYPEFCNGLAIPFADGIYFPNETFDKTIQTRFYNNGIAELFYSLTKQVKKMSDKSGTKIIFPVSFVLQIVEKFIEPYTINSLEISGSKRIFLCASILGCDNCISDEQKLDFDNYIGIVDSYKIYCMPVEIEDASDLNCVKEATKMLKTVICLSLGIRNIDKYVK